ncbi:MAG: pseudouridine-5'-phosphate glycosidase [Anaerolineae bacterium]|nr:pseudouridine-5'-phosphate glycosidase [Anaerolineae bacterium]
MQLTIASPVADALNAGKPVVALESTAITHGLPVPQNVETAMEMEAAVFEEGAHPATIAVLQGRVVVGLDAQEIDTLGKTSAEKVRKCSRRDLPIAVGLGETASTTVAGTMIVAQQAGIPVFATGGIGGVHRGHPFDISADLIELGRTPVAVVCSGPKSILDLELTREVLETQGVPVVGFGTDRLPSFISRTSTLPVDVRVDTEEDAASIIRAQMDMNRPGGILICVPVPADVALAQDQAEAAIVTANEEARRKRLRGASLTPYLLTRVAELTGGASLAANTVLLANNARIAARIAAAL